MWKQFLHAILKKVHKLISISTLTGWIEKQGGIGSAIGGNVDAIAEALAAKHGRKKLKATRRVMKSHAGRAVTIVARPTGKIFVKDLSRTKQSIRVRYYEAKRILDSDPRLRLH